MQTRCRACVRVRIRVHAGKGSVVQLLNGTVILLMISIRVIRDGLETTKWRNDHLLKL